MLSWAFFIIIKKGSFKRKWEKTEVLSGFSQFLKIIIRDPGFHHVLFIYKCYLDVFLTSNLKTMEWNELAEKRQELKRLPVSWLYEEKLVYLQLIQRNSVCLVWLL